ncbi:MAG: nitroreductase family protein [Planctomycetes bacterium]|nr:nitroreductase family protein [Planctomycetota bacterium]
MDALKAIESRRSVRSFKPDPVTEDALRSLVDAGRLAPSANNVQPWEFVAVTDPGMRARIAEATDYGGFIASAPACLAVFCRDVKYYLEDGSAAVENILVAAAAQGLGTCWVAGDKKPYADTVRKMLGVPETHRLVALIAVGFPSRAAARPAKRTLDEVFHWETY